MKIFIVSIQNAMHMQNQNITIRNVVWKPINIRPGKEWHMITNLRTDTRLIITCLINTKHDINGYLMVIRNILNKNYITGDFNLNLLDHSLNKKVQNYLNLIYQNSFITTVNKPAMVTRKTSTIIDHILTNLFVNTNFKTFIFKIDILDHFPICFLQRISRPREENEATYITKRVINNNVIEVFKQELYKTNWDDVINNKNPNNASKYFLHKVFFDCYLAAL